MRSKHALASAVVLVAMGSFSCGGEEATQTAATSPKSDVQIIRETELARIKALTANDIEQARSLRGDDFRLKAPNGETLTKDEYLEAVGSGRLRPLGGDFAGRSHGYGGRSQRPVSVPDRVRRIVRRDHGADAQRHLCVA